MRHHEHLQHAILMTVWLLQCMWVRPGAVSDFRLKRRSEQNGEVPLKEGAGLTEGVHSLAQHSSAAVGLGDAPAAKPLPEPTIPDESGTPLLSRHSIRLPSHHSKEASTGGYGHIMYPSLQTLAFLVRLLRCLNVPRWQEAG